jgi:HSP20 family molecular chaperone IbpA
LSAKWRRDKTKSKRFDFLKVFNKSKSKNVPRRFDVSNSSVKKIGLTNYKVQRVSAEKKSREPRHLVDVLEEDDEIIVVADFAGFSRENVNIQAKSQRLTLVAEGSGRKYRKSLNLPKRVIPSTLHTTYKNGVLEIRLKKVAEKSLGKIAGQTNAA